MGKFKVGDFVEIKSWEEMEREFGMDEFGDIKTEINFVSYMQYLCGKKAKVKSVDRFGVIKFEDGIEGMWKISEDMLKPATNPEFNMKIVITYDGIATVARWYDGKNLAKTAVACCSRQDEFDFLTGAKLAVERLGEPKKPMPMLGGDIVAKRKIECKVCGAEFQADCRAHYLAKEEKGLGGALCGNKTHDAFDCPVCGCQNLVGEYLPKYSPSKDEEDPEDE